MQFKGFRSLFLLDKDKGLVPLSNDLRDLEQWIREADVRIAKLTAGEPISTSPTGGSNSSISKHAATHVTQGSENFSVNAGSDLITKYPITWFRGHTWEPSTVSTVPITVTLATSQTADALVIQSNGGSRLLTVDEVNAVGINDDDPQAHLVVRATAGGTEADVLALGPTMWFDSSDANGTDNSGLTDGSTVATWVDKSGNSHSVSKASGSTVNFKLYTLPAVDVAHPTTLPNSKPIVSPVNIGATAYWAEIPTYPGANQATFELTAYTIIVVSQTNTAINFLSGVPFNNNYPTGVPGNRIRINFSGGSYYVDVGYRDPAGGSAATQYIAGPITMPSGTWMRTSILRTGATHTISINDVTIPHDSTVGDVTGTQYLAEMGVYLIGDGGGFAHYQPDPAPIAEILLFSRVLTDLELATVYSYLDNKYYDGVEYTASSPAGSAKTYVQTWEDPTGAIKAQVSSGFKLGVNATPSARIHSIDTAEPLRIGYDTSNYASFAVSSGGNLTLTTSVGDVTITPAGGDTTITGTATVTTSFSAGAAKFTVNSTGNITKINNVTTSWPSSQGSANTVLHNDGSGTLTWALVTLTTDVTGTLPIGNGGTGLATYTAGDTIYWASGTAFTKVAIGSAGQIYRSTGTAPAWSTFTISDTYTTGDLLYASGANTLTGLADVATGSVLTSGGVGVAPAWATLATAGIVPTSRTLTAGAGLTGGGDLSADRTFNVGAGTGITVNTDDVALTAPVTIALGGTNSTTALSGSTIMISNGTQVVQGAAGTTSTVLHGNAAGAPTYGAVALATEVSGLLAVANGGTGHISGNNFALHRLCGGI